MTTAAKKIPPGIRLLPSGLYQARYSVTRDGVTKQESAGAFRTLQEAKDARLTALYNLKAGQHVKPSGPRMTTKEWATEWLELTGKQNNLRTLSFLKVHILPAFGHRRIGDVEVADVQRWVNQLYTPDRAWSTSEAIYGQYKAMMQAAVDYDKLVKSPCRLIKRPKGKVSKPVALSRSNLLRLEWEAPDRYKTMVHLAAWCGLRWQECAGLQWDDVDLEHGVLNIRHAVKADGTLGPPKNGREREVVMPESATWQLRMRRRDMGGEGYVFTTVRGNPLSYQVFRRDVWAPLVGRVKIKVKPGFHDLRHSYVSQLVEAGVDPKVISEQVGHYDPGFTMSRYGTRRPDYATVLQKAVKKAQGM